MACRDPSRMSADAVARLQCELHNQPSNWRSFHISPCAGGSEPILIFFPSSAFSTPLEPWYLQRCHPYFPSNDTVKTETLFSLLDRVAQLPQSAPSPSGVACGFPRCKEQKDRNNGTNETNEPNKMFPSLLTKLLILLSLLHLTLASSHQAAVGAAHLESRDDSPIISPAQSSPACLDYERTANMSVIGKNGSYRTAFLQQSSLGTMYSARILDSAMAKLPALTADKALNEACGNWTEIAVKEAAANYSQGIVAEFSTEGLPHGIKAGPVVVVVIGVICILFSTLWVFIV